MKKIKEILSKFDLNDIWVLVGVGIFCWGIWEIYPPAAMIIAGAGMIWWGIAGSRKAKSK